MLSKCKVSKISPFKTPHPTTVYIGEVKTLGAVIQPKWQTCPLKRSVLGKNVKSNDDDLQQEYENKYPFDQ